MTSDLEELILIPAASHLVVNCPSECWCGSSDKLVFPPAPRDWKPLLDRIGLPRKDNTSQQQPQTRSNAWRQGGEIY
ncbi:hypothetical protein AMECASPLE_009585 [Ameca splendens]|uniref:Uncharacterized protein n=1 Tax=Ameca splendens TaxID=208324 RepID=A0ABV0YY85_9TELE